MVGEILNITTRPSGTLFLSLVDFGQKGMEDGLKNTNTPKQLHHCLPSQVDSLQEAPPTENRGSCCFEMAAVSSSWLSFSYSANAPCLNQQVPLSALALRGGDTVRREEHLEVELCIDLLDRRHAGGIRFAVLLLAGGGVPRGESGGFHSALLPCGLLAGWRYLDDRPLPRVRLLESLDDEPGALGVLDVGAHLPDHGRLSEAVQKVVLHLEVGAHLHQNLFGRPELGGVPLPDQQQRAGHGEVEGVVGRLVLHDAQVGRQGVLGQVHLPLGGGDEIQHLTRGRLVGGLAGMGGWGDGGGSDGPRPTDLVFKKRGMRTSRNRSRRSA